MSPVKSVVIPAVVCRYPPRNTGWVSSQSSASPVLSSLIRSGPVLTAVQSGWIQLTCRPKQLSICKHVWDGFNLLSAADWWSSVGRSNSPDLNFRSFSSKVENSTHLARRQTTWAKYVQIQTDPGLIQGLDGDSAGYLLIVNDKVRIALVVVEDDIDLGVHPVVHTGVEKVTGRVTRVDGWRSPHGGVSYS